MEQWLLRKNLAKQIKRAEHILPALLVLATGHDRYIPAREWNPDFWTNNLFRFYERCFGRRAGLRAESSFSVGQDRNGKPLLIYHCFSLEASIGFLESYLRGKFKGLKGIKVWVPAFSANVPDFGLPSPFLFAIAFEEAANNGTSSSSANTAESASVTLTGSNRIAIGGAAFPSAVSVSSMTINSVSFTAINTSTTPSTNSKATLSYLINPASGAQTFTVNFSASGSATKTVGVMIYSGASQSGQPDSSNTLSTTTTSISPTTTVVATNCWIVGIAIGDSNTPEILGPGFVAGRIDNNNNSRALGMNDSNGTVGTGSQSITWTNGLGSSIGWASVTASIAALQPPLTPSVSDTTAMSEAQQLQIVSFVNKSDTTAMSELSKILEAFQLSKADTTAMSDAVALSRISFGMPIVEFRSASAPYAVLNSIAYTQSTLGGNLLPVKEGENSSINYFRIYNNFNSVADIATVYNVRITTYDGAGAGSHTATQSPVSQSWVHIYETGFGENALEPGSYTQWLGEDTAIGRSGGDSYTPEYGSDGTLTPYIRANADGNGAGFIEFATYAQIPSGAGFANYNLAVTMNYQWSS